MKNKISRSPGEIWQNPWGETYGTWAEALIKRFSTRRTVWQETLKDEHSPTAMKEHRSTEQTDYQPIFALYSNFDPSLEVQTLDSSHSCCLGRSITVILHRNLPLEIENRCSSLL